jgi:hypothetical protein
MRLRVVATLAVIVVLALAGCGITKGSGKVVTESRVVSGFSAVVLAGSGDLIVTQGGPESLSIEAEDNLLRLITAGVTGDTLTIGFKPGEVVQATKPIVYRLNLSTLRALTLSGSGSVRSDNLTADSLRVSLSGSGGITLQKITVTDLVVDLSGSGSIVTAGEAKQLDASLSGSGSYKAPDLKTSAAKVSISGSGSVTVWALESLATAVSGSGSVAYYGKPAVTSTGSGSGSVKSLGDK